MSSWSECSRNQYSALTSRTIHRSNPCLNFDSRQHGHTSGPTSAAAIELETEAVEDTAAGGEVTVLGLEDLFTTDPAFDGDYNDVIVAVSEAPLSADTVNSLLGELGTAAGADSVIT